MSAIDKNSFCSILIKDYGFAPIEVNENRNNFTSLHKLEAGTRMIVEIHDSSGVSTENMTNELNETCDRIFNSNSREAIHFFKVFLFEHSPFQGVVTAMTDAQFIDPVSKRHLSCYYIDISAKELKKLFPEYVKSQSIDGALHKLLNEDVIGSPGYDTKEIHQMIVDMKNADEGNRLRYYTDKPVVSYVLIALNLFIYFVTYAITWKMGKDYTFALGIKNNGLIIDGEIYRLIMPMFLHGSVAHVMMNCYSLYSLSIIEKLYGHVKFSIIYFVAGLMGVAASFAFNIADSLGASGAVFGLFGALLYFGVENPKQFAMYFQKGILLTLFLNVTLAVQNKSIDHFAHFGGLIGGFLTAGVLMVEVNIEKYKNRLAYFVAAVVILFGLIYYGCTLKTNNAMVGASRVKQYFGEGKYAKVLEQEDKVLKYQEQIPGDYLEDVYIYLAIASLEIDNLSKLKEFSTKLVSIQPFEGHRFLCEYYIRKDDKILAQKEYQSSKSSVGASTGTLLDYRNRVLVDLNSRLTSRIGN